MDPTAPPPPPDPAQPVLDLPARMAGAAADVAASVGPGFFAVLTAMLILSVGVVLIRRSLP